MIEIEPELKQLLHSALQREGLTLKDWFVDRARKFVYEDGQLGLDFSGQVASAPVGRDEQ